MAASQEDEQHHNKTFGPAHDALNRMRRAYERGTGCHLTAEMIQVLNLTVIGAMWAEDDPRNQKGA